MKSFEIYIDGASKGNPGPSGVGVVICRNGEMIKNLSSYIGNATNNVAEYTALIYALEESLVLKADEIKVKTDSELLYRQLKKIYKIRDPGIRGLYERVSRLSGAFKSFEVVHIRREDNKGADRLATKAVREALVRKVLR